MILDSRFKFSESFLDYINSYISHYSTERLSAFYLYSRYSPKFSLSYSFILDYSIR